MSEPTTENTTPTAPVPPNQPRVRTIQPIQIQRGDRRASFKTFFSYGKPRSGKTRFLATWPRPLVIADATERGWNTMETMPSEFFYEPDRPPLVWPIENALQMEEALLDARPLVDRGDVFTLGVDSLTFYADTYFNWLRRRTAELNPGKPIDSRALYGALADHLQDSRIKIHKWPCNVGWLALEKAPDDTDREGGPLLTGKARQKFPAGCDHIFYHRSYTLPNEAGVQEPYYEMHTAPYGVWLAGGRDSGMLEASMFNPTYRDIATAMNLLDPIEAFERAREAGLTASSVVDHPEAPKSTTVTRRVVRK